MSIAQNNQIINQFRKLEIGRKEYKNDYHTNWNSLHAAIDEINDRGYCVTISKYSCHIRDTETNKVVVKETSKSSAGNHLLVWVVVAEFCDKYNKGEINQNIKEDYSWRVLSRA